MKTNNDLSAHSAKGLGAVVAHAVVAHAIPADAPTRSLSQRGNQRNVTLGKATGRRALLGNGVTYYNVTLGSVTHYVRAAMMLLMMLLTATTAWAEDVPAVYALTFNTSTQKTTLTRNGGNYESVTWDFISGTNSTPWNAGATHGVDDEYDITFKPNKYLTLVGSDIKTSAETKFTVTVGDNAYYIKSASIGGVTATAGLHAKTIEVTVPDNTYIRGFNVTLIRYHTVTPASGLHVTSGTSATSGGTTYYKPGTIVTVAPTNTHHIVEGAGGTGSASVSVASDKRSFSFTMPDQDVSPTATLTEVYRVSPASGITLSPAAYFTYGGAQYYKPNTTITLSSTVPTGQHVIYKAGNKTLAGNTYTVNSSDGDVTLTAEYPYNTYTVHFNGNGSTSGSMSNQVFTFGTAQNLKANAFTRTGYTFAGWNTQADGNGTSYANGESVKNLTTTNNGTVTLYAQWTANQYTVKFDGQSATTTGTTEVTATYDAAMPAITVPTRTGYTFGGYFTQTNGGGTQYYNADGTSAHIWDKTAATTLYAKWTIKQYTITFVTGNGGTAINPITQDYNTSITAPADPERTGYTFAGWNPDIPTMMPAGDMTVTAQWTPIDYDINYDLNGGELPSQQSNPATYNVETNTFTLINPTRKGYTFAGWTEGNGTTRQTTVTITKGSTTGALTYTAHWTLNTYTITYNLVYGNVATANKTTYTVEDDDFTLNNPTKDHFTFTGWIGSNGTTPQTAVTITKGSYAEDLCYTANYAVGAHDGTCGADGADVYYAYDSSTNTFEIFGTGDMKDYDRDTDRPWNGYRADITTVVIGNGVKSIGSQAFYDCSSLTSITIPASVTNISDNAFNKCSSLASITIPTGVTSIGNSAFRNCTALTSIEIPTSVTSIGMLAFSNCSSLTGITIPDGVTSIGRGTFYGCSSLTSIEIPAKVTSIGFGAFESCTSLTSINIPDGVTIIDDNIFRLCTSLTGITIPNGVTSIGSHAFSTCTSLASIEIPANVTTIGDYAFNVCNGLESISVAAGNTTYDSRNDCNALIETATNKLIQGCKNTVIPDGVTTIGKYAFDSCTGLTSIEIPASVTTIGIGAFFSCTGLTSIEIPASVTTIGGEVFYGCTSLKSIEIPASVTSIDDFAFVGCTSLASISVAEGNPTYDSRKECNAIIETKTNTLLYGCKNTVIPDGVTTIGEYAFEGCTALASIEIPASVTSIGGYAFKGCTALPSIEIPASVTSIGDAAFSGCTSLNTVFLYSVNPPALGTNAFSACTALNTIVVPTGKAETYKDANGWKAYASKILAIDGTCGNNVYYSYDSTSKTLNIFGTGAMANYSIWNQWDIPWYGYGTDITTVVIADGVTSIGDYVFFDCTSLASITIPASVTSIGSAAFSNCNGLASIEIPIRVTSIGSSAFASCASLTSVTIPASVTSIGSSAFIGCTSLTSIEIPASVTSIGNEVFSGCTRLTSIEIPASVTSIGNEAFSYCTSLASISVAAGNTVYDSRNNCNAIIETETNTLIAGCKNTVIPDGTDGVTSIGDYAFWGCTDLTTITIPASVTSIGAGAFERCTSLTSIEIPTSVTSMGAGAFTGCTSLTSFKIPASVTSIGNYAFGDCTSLESITIPDGVTSIGENAFYGCTSLTSIEIPASVTSIGGSAFWCCTSLTSIEIPASVTSFGGGAFKDCTSLNSVTIYAPELGEHDGYLAFDGNASGRKIYVFENCMGYYKAKAEDMGANENDIEAITDISLKDNDDNRSLIAAASGNSLKVKLEGRTLYKDGDWNTLCLPFDVSTATGTLSGDHVLAMVLRQSDSGLEGTTLTLNFDNAPATIPAGTPFIIRWGTPQTNPGTTLTDPVFTGVTIDNSNDAIARKTQTSTDGTVSFKGTYAKQEYTEENKSILFLGAGNNLYYPQPSDGKLPTIGAFRAYFELTGSTEARQFVLNFGEETGIGHTEITEITEKADAWYTLDGVKLDGKPTKKGLYIHGGRKVVVK